MKGLGVKRYKYAGIWKRYKFGQVSGKWWWKEMQNVWGMSISKRKRMCLKKYILYRHKNLSWHCVTKEKKSNWKEYIETKHLGLAKNRLRPRIKGTLLVLGALY